LATLLLGIAWIVSSIAAWSTCAAAFRRATTTKHRNRLRYLGVSLLSFAVGDLLIWIGGIPDVYVGLAARLLGFVTAALAVLRYDLPDVRWLSLLALRVAILSGLTAAFYLFVVLTVGYASGVFASRAGLVFVGSGLGLALLLAAAIDVLLAPRLHRLFDRIILRRAYDNHWIQLDVNAAGHGWFIDETPEDDAEFPTQRLGLAADTQGSANGKIDALTVLMHELGHLYGYQDEVDSVSLMGATLPPGTRRLPDGEPVGSNVNNTPKADANLSVFRSRPLDLLFAEEVPAEPRVPVHSSELPPRRRIASRPLDDDRLETVISAFAVTDDAVARTAAVDALFTEEEETQQDLAHALWENDLLGEEVAADLLRGPSDKTSKKKP